MPPHIFRTIFRGPVGNVPRIGNQPAPYRGLSGPPGPKCRKSLENVSRDLRPRAPKKSPKSPGTLQKHSPDTFRRLSGDLPDCPRDFFETFGGLGAGGLGRHFRDFFGISGAEGPRDLCKGRAGSQPAHKFCTIFEDMACSQNLPLYRQWMSQLYSVCSQGLQVRADFREGDEDSNFSVFTVRRFSEWPEPLHWIAFPVEILTKPLIHWIASPLFTEKPFSSLKRASSHPLPRNRLWTGFSLLEASFFVHRLRHKPCVSLRTTAAAAAASPAH